MNAFFELSPIEDHAMKQTILILLVFLRLSPVFAFPNPTVTLTTPAFGYPYTAPFTVNVEFSEPVTGFNESSVNIVNAIVTNIYENQEKYTLTITPTLPGPITMFVPANVVKSLSTGSVNKVSNKLNVMALNPSLHPSSNFDLSTWNLTLPLPLGDINNAMTIDATTLNGYPTFNTGYVNPPYFFTNEITGSIDFFAPIHGATTLNSVFPRCELSEALTGQSHTWNLGSYESNMLTASLLVSQVPPSKKIVIGKIQDKGNTDNLDQPVGKKAMVKLYYDLNTLDPNGNLCNGCLYARIRPVPAEDIFLKTVTLAQNIPLNKLFIYKITLLRDGTLTVKVNNKATTVNLNISTDNTVGWGSQQLYFQAGVYVLDNGTSDYLGGANSFYSLQIKHTGCPICPKVSA